MNKHNSIQVSDTQEHTNNIVSNNRDLTERSEQTVSDQHMDKQDQQETRKTYALINHKYT